MSAFRFGIVGCGGIAGVHASLLGDLKAAGIAELVAGAEVDAERRESFSKTWSIPVYDSLTTMLVEADLDAVAVCSPSGLHSEHIIESALAKKHILSEKPGDVYASRVAKAIDVARENGVVFGGIFQQRFHMQVLKVKAAIDQGYFGEIQFVHCETPWYRGQDYYDSGEWRGTWALDGGVLSNQSPHMIDRVLFLAGDVAEVEHAVVETRHRNIEAETLGIAVVRLVNGAVGTITGTTLSFDGMPQRVLISGTEGNAGFVGDELVNFRTKREFVFDAPDLEASPVEKPVEGKASVPLMMGTDAHRRNYVNFINAVHSGEKPLVTGEDQYRVSLVLNKIYAKAKVGLFKDGVV